MERKYKRTLYACYIGYITQAVVVNLAPLLFVIFQQEFAISLGQIGSLVTYNFCVQILVDFLGARYVDRLGYKRCVILAHAFCAVGLVSLGLLPELLPSPYVGLLAATTLYAMGGGLLEVVISPTVEALPTEGKAAAMSLLHSFYCWGQALVVLLTTLLLRLAGQGSWRYLTVLWALIPLGNMLLFAVSPVRQLSQDGGAMPMKKLLGQKLFWLLALLMLCSGAAELSMSQWSSFFAERGLGVDKTLGDLLGPCLFAVLMGVSRWFYGTRGDKIPLRRFIVLSGCLCVCSYLIAVFSPWPVVSLAGCGLCGLSVGILWPGVFSLAAEACPQVGTAMFGLLAMAGDVGCAAGPSVVGLVSEGFGGELRAGLLAATVFPVVLMAGIRMLRKK